MAEIDKRLHQSLLEMRLGLRLMYCDRYRCPPGWHIQINRYIGPDFIGFFLVEKGSCWLHLNRGRRIDLKERDLLVWKGSDVLEMGNHSKAHTSLSIGITEGQEGSSNSLIHRRFDRIYSLPNSSAYVSRFNEILKGLASPPAVRDLMAAGALMQWIGYVLQETQAPLQTHAMGGHLGIDKIMAAQTWALGHLADVLTVDQWAAEMRWHPVYFEKVFKRETGLTPIRWLEERRMDAARRYLSVTGQSVSQIAEAVGYTDPFYFSRVFRKHFGKSPQFFRKSGIFCAGFEKKTKNRSQRTKS